MNSASEPQPPSEQELNQKKAFWTRVMWISILALISIPLAELTGSIVGKEEALGVLLGEEQGIREDEDLSLKAVWIGALTLPVIVALFVSIVKLLGLRKK